MGKQGFAWLILLIFLLLKLLAPPAASVQKRAAAFLGLERERIAAIGSAGESGERRRVIASDS